MKNMREYKTDLRRQMREKRLSYSPVEKKEADGAIVTRVCATKAYQRAKTLLCYVSTPIEVDTHALIQRALQDNKRVAVPRCIPGEISMEFLVITRWEELQPGAFGVLEPSPACCPKLTDFSESLCVVPGLSFDHAGFRLGYGKGYYDRFLSQYPCPTIGICYADCVRRSLLHGRYDVAVDLLVTEHYQRVTNPKSAR